MHEIFFLIALILLSSGIFNNRQISRKIKGEIAPIFRFIAVSPLVENSGATISRLIADQFS